MITGSVVAFDLDSDPYWGISKSLAIHCWRLLHMVSIKMMGLPIPAVCPVGVSPVAALDLDLGLVLVLEPVLVAVAVSVGPTRQHMSKECDIKTHAVHVNSELRSDGFCRRLAPASLDLRNNVSHDGLIHLLTRSHIAHLRTSCALSP